MKKPQPNVGHRFTKQTARAASRKYWWKDGKPRPVGSVRPVTERLGRKAKP